ncbi:MAG: VWA domain-containing protein [Methylococcales bacterium]|nr:VWA domain-containing protein [Methylococcales bacterium]
MRRLPVFLVLDVSDSMIGDPHRYLEAGVAELTKKLRQDPQALETVFLSVIAFAAQVKTLVPLIDLPTFYPPKLPIGSGTSFGAALDHLMYEIDNHVVKTTHTSKGDWKPVIYFLTDGKPTDKYKDAVKKWRDSYAKRCHFIAIGLGQFADLTVLSDIANDSFVYNGEQETDFARFIQWMTMSVKSQSVLLDKAPNASEGISLAKAGGFLEQFDFDGHQSDDDSVIFVGRCQNSQRAYLIKYDRVPAVMEMNLDLSDVDEGQKMYHVSGAYPVDEDYFEWSEKDSVNPIVNVKNLLGGVACPCCGNPYSLALCKCENIFCVGENENACCPWCDSLLKMYNSTDKAGFTITRSRG